MPSRRRPRPEIRDQALSLLARREHSRAELRGKLRRSGYDSTAVDRLLDVLEAEGLLSHARYAQSYVRARVERGYGPRRIAFELRERGVEHTLIDEALAEYEGEWLARARAQYERRFGAAGAADFRERARRVRFLEQRGFPAEIIRQVVRDG